MTEYVELYRASFLPIFAANGDVFFGLTNGTDFALCRVTRHQLELLAHEPSPSDKTTNALFETVREIVEGAADFEFHFGDGFGPPIIVGKSQVS